MNWNRRSLMPPQFTRQQIIEIAEGLTKEFYHSFIEFKVEDTRLISLNVDVIFDSLIYPKYNIGLNEDEDLGIDEVTGEKHIGKYQPEDNTIFLDRIMHNDPRRVFTFCHELGHAFLHGDFFRKVMQGSRLPREVVTTESMLSQNASQQLERQANLFASRFAAPDWLLATAILDTFDPKHQFIYEGPGKYWFVAHENWFKLTVEDFNDFCRTIASFIQHRFGGLSRESLGYRIAETSLIKRSQTRRIELRRTARPALALDTNVALTAAFGW